jgi:serine/threonine protein kinase
MGVVYKAHDPDLGRMVAIKLVHAGSTAARSTRLLREAQAIARVAHPNIVAIYDVGLVDDQVFIAMEYVEGQWLRDWMSTGPRTLREILHVFEQCAHGLAAAHDAGLVHRDFKPENVLLGSDGRVRVVDFGLVRWAEDDDGAADHRGRHPRARSEHHAGRRRGRHAALHVARADPRAAGGRRRRSVLVLRVPVRGGDRPAAVPRRQHGAADARGDLRRRPAVPADLRGAALVVRGDRARAVDRGR